MSQSARLVSENWSSQDEPASHDGQSLSTTLKAV